MSTSPTENDIYIPNGITDTSDATALDVLPQREAQRESSDDREQETKIKTGTGQGDEATDLGSQERDEAQLVDAGERFEEEKDESENGIDGMDAEGGARAENTVSLHDEQTFEAAPQADTSEHASSSLIANEPAADEEALAPREAADGAPEAESGADVTDTQSPAPRNANIRPPTPSSRTSTPPLTAPSRKFSSINVNKKFLTKTASPAAGASATVTKLGSLSASPVSISSAPSRLLSTKLTTIPSSKSNISPHPPSSAGTAGSPSNSPWAKPAASLGGESPQDSRPLHQPAPRQSRSLTTTIPVVMGSGQGISVLAPKPAWRQVPVEGRRAALGVSRDFPTTNEIAEGKKAAVMAAQAQAAHNQAILQGLNAFTQLDSNTHRWDDEDDDDDPIDFGDGTVYYPHEHLDSTLAVQSEPVVELPVPKSERFAEDFDRSWPRGRGPPPALEPSLGLPRRPDVDNRVLFNASLNRLEPTSNRPAPPLPQPRLMARPDPSPADSLPTVGNSALQALDRPLPPHLQATDTGRMLPPHMTALPHQTDVKAANVSSTVLSTSGRRPWALTKEPERLTASQQVERGGADPQLTASETGLPPSRPIISSLPAGQSSVQARPTTLPPPPVNPAPTTTTPSTTSPSVPSSLPVDPQSAEMHSAAEKARLRRLAEEAEREATAGRARRKAKELEERLGLKSTAPETKAVEASSAPAVPPGAAKTSTPAFTLATRPKLAADIPQPVTSSMQAASTIAGLPPRPAGDQRVGESSWRARLMGENPKIIDGVPGSSREQANPAVSNERPARPTAESFFESQSDAHPSRDGLPGNSLVGEAPAYAPPPISDPSDALNPAPESNVTYSIDAEQSFLPKKESNFDSMLARIQAAMAEARERSAPPSSSPLTAVVPTSASKTEEELHPETLQGPGRISTAPRAAFTSAALPISPQPPSKLTIIPAANLRPEFFDVSQPLPPPSPPPAWRTYAVRLPKPETTKSPLAGSRLRAFESTSKPPPDGWLMTFEPPIDQLSPFSLSRAELLLPQPMQRRFSKHADMGPLVSISPRRLELYQKRIKRKVSNVPRPLEVFVPSTAAESLLMSATTTPAVTATSQQSRSQHPMSFDNRWQEDVRTKAADAADTLPRSPLRTSPTRAQMDGISKLDMTMNGQPDRGRMPLDVKPPGVRFMVSSELEGDSLLDEVNKMSLESVGEGEDKGNELARENESKTPGTETPKTPSVSGASSRGRPSSPNGASTPWTKSSTRSSSQHDHLKSVWDQAGTPEPSLPIEPFATQKPLMPARKQATDTASPMYPSLNAPSSADPPAPQPLPSSVKMGYSNSQSFSSPGSAPQSTSFRQSPGNNYGYTSPDVGQSMMGLSYASLGGARPNGSSANGFPGVQQGVWSASAFGTGYGYGAKAAQSIAGMDHKAATAFNTATNGKNQAQMYHTAYAQHAHSPQGYPPQGFGGAQSYGQAQAQMSAQYGRGVSSPQGGGGYYQYGAPDALQLSGRMSTGQRGSGYPVGIGAYGESAGYYGGVAGQQGQAPGIYQNYAGHGAIGQQGRGGATAGVGQGQGARKVW